MGKVKQEKDTAQNESNVNVKDEELSYEEKIENCSIIAKPMASKKLAKKCYKLIKKGIINELIEFPSISFAYFVGIKHKTYVRNGLKDVQTRIRKGETGIVIFAGDVTPIDIMCHLPIVCEEKDIPYCYTPSRTDLGAALGIKRGCLMVLVREHEDYKEAFDECKGEIKTLAVDL